MRTSSPSRIGATVLRMLAVLALVVGSAAITSGTAAAAGQAGQARAEDETSPLAGLNSCLVERKAGDVLIMLDESPSITDTDKAGARIDAAKALVTSLAARVADPDSEISGAKLDVTVASFGDVVKQDGQPVDPAQARWAALDQQGLSGVLDTVEAYRTRLTGLETDYWTALKWIVDAENAHSKAATTVGCHLVFWFTDGTYSIGARDGRPVWQGETSKRTPWTENGSTPATTQPEADRIRDDGAKDLCRPGGLADQIRRSGLTMAAIGLGSNESDFELMKRIATNPTGDCGNLPGTGVFDRADITTLLLLVEGLGSSATQLPIETQPVCQVRACESVHKFTLDSSLRKVHIVGVPSVPGLRVQVRSPKGETATIEPIPAGGNGQPGSTAVSGIDLRYQWVSDRQLTVDMVRPTDATNWSGQWTVVFIDTTGSNPDAVAATRVSLSADLALIADPAPTEATAGEKLPLKFALTSLTGAPPVLGSPPPTMTATVRAIPSASGAKPVQIIGSGPIDRLTGSAGSWDVPTDFPLGPAKIEVTLAITTVSGIKLDPVVRQYSLVVKPAKGTPTLVSTGLDFGSVEGVTPGSTTLTVTGPGCVWVTGGQLITHPAGVDAVTIGGPSADQSSCLTLGEGERKDLTVTATPAAAGNGSVGGEVVVHLAPEGHPERAGQQTVPYTMEMRRAAQTTVVIGVFAVALLVGVGLPILVLWLTRRIAARYPADVQLLAARVPVLAGPGGLTTPGGAAVQLPDQWGSVPPPVDGRRGLLVAGVKLRARTGPLWSAQPGYSEADRPGTGGATPFFAPKTFSARLPLAVQGSWALLFRGVEDLGGQGRQVAGELLLITHPSATEQARRTLLGEALSQGPGLVSTLRDSVREATGQPPVGPAPDGGPPPEPAAPNQPARPAGAPDPVPGWGSAAPRPTQAPPGWGVAGPTGRPDAAPGWGTQQQPGWGGQPQQPGWGGQPPQPGAGGQPPQPGGAPPSAPGWPSSGGGPRGS